MTDETVTPAQPEAVEVTDVETASNALQSLLDFGGEPEQPNDDGAPAEQVEETATPEPEAELDDAPVADESDNSADNEETEVQVAEEPADYFEVTLPGGEKAEVTLDELQRGYSREQDYTRKTEDLAGQRRALAAEREQAQQAVEQNRQQYAQRLHELAQTVGVNLQAEQSTDWDQLKEEDPVEFATRWADHQRKQEQFRTAQAELQHFQQEEQQKMQQQHQQVLAEQSRRLAEALPQYADEEKGEQFRNDLRSFLKNNYGGFNDNEIGSVVDARHVQLIHDAMQWRKLQDGKTTTEKKVRPLPKVVKPSAQAQKVDTDAEQIAAKMKRARKSGSVRDAADALVDIL